MNKTFLALSFSLLCLTLLSCSGGGGGGGAPAATPADIEVINLSDDSTPVLSKTWVWDCNNLLGNPCEYRFIVNTSATFTFTIEPYSATTTINQPNGDAVYYLHVQARDTITLDESEIVSVSAILDNSAPSDPSSGNLTNTFTANASSSPLISWSASSDANNLSYEVCLGTSAGANDVQAWQDIGTSASASLSGLTLAEGIDYFASIRAVDEVGNTSSVHSNFGSFCYDNTAPSTPTGLSLTGVASETNSPQLSWSASTDACSGVLRYEVSLSTTAGGNDVINWTSVNLNLNQQFISITPSLSFGTNYYLNVRAVDNAGKISAAASSSAWNIPGSSSETITSLVAPANATYSTGGEINFQINYSGNANVTGSPRLSLNIGGSTVYAQYSSGSGTQGIEFKYTVVPGNSDSDGITLNSTLINLNGGTIKDDLGDTLPIDFTAFIPILTSVLVDTTNLPPDKVTNVNVAPTAGSTTLNISWNVPNNNGNAITHYVVQYREKGTSTWLNKSPNPTINQTTISGLTSATLYEIRVAANNGALGAYSDIVEYEIFNILTLNPIAWLDGTDINGDTTQPSDGAKVASWVDKSGVATNATEAVAANQPVYQYNVQNGLPAVYFDNNDRGLQGTFNRTINSGLTIFVVGSFDAAYSDRCIFEFWNGGARAFFIDRRYAGNTLFSPILTKGSFKLWRVEDSGTVSSVYENQSAIQFNTTNTFNTSFTGTGNYILGDDSTGGNRMTGHIGEFLVFDGALSGADIDKIETYLADKWGIALP